jgi:hypothetical protein
MPPHERPGSGADVLTRAFEGERVTGIEPALSAWEQDSVGTYRCPTCGDVPMRASPGCPSLTTVDRALVHAGGTDVDRVFVKFLP